MAAVELIMPKMGESIMEATILKWLKKEGETVAEDESVLEIATDKVDSEVPSPVDGVIGKLLFEEGETVEVGKPIAIINTEGEPAAAPAGGAAAEPEKETAAEAVASTTETAAAATATATTAKTLEARPPSRDGNGRFYSPLVLNIAREENIPMTELEQIPGSGKNNRVTKKDILAYIKEKEARE